MSGGGGELVPEPAAAGELPDAADADTIARLASALSADMADLETYERVLASTISAALPEGVIEVTRERSLSDRMSKRPGKVTSIRLRFGEQSLELRTEHGRLAGYAERSVRGVSIQHRPVGLDEWTRLFAAGLAHLAAQNAAAREALGRILGAGP